MAGLSMDGHIYVYWVDGCIDFLQENPTQTGQSEREETSGGENEREKGEEDAVDMDEEFGGVVQDIQREDNDESEGL